MTQTADLAAQPGRLGDPAMDLRTDPRLKPRLREALAAFGLDGPAAGSTITRADPLPVQLEAVGQQDAGFEGLYAALPNALPGDDDVKVSRTSETVRGVDGNDIELQVYRPVDAGGPLPCVVYVHGGGMTILKAFSSVHERWCEGLAATGLVVVGVDFRNAWTAGGHHPFPAGLDDCSSALAWVHAHREQLGASTVVLQGESGGANLALATVLKAKRDGLLGTVDGVYAAVPYVSGGYAWDRARKLQELPSLVENDLYFINCQAMDLLVSVYDPDAADAENPLCWPYFARPQDVAGLPPHRITVNELDPLRDEGQAYYRTLLHAGVPVTGRRNLGLTHAAELIFRQAVPEEHRAALDDVNRFAHGL